MENIKLTYQGKNYKEIFPEENDFFEMQKIIRNDLKSLRYKIEDCINNDNKSNLLSHINHIIDSLQYNNNFEESIVPLNISLTNKYLAFSYYDKDETEDDICIMNYTPNYVIISRNMKEIYYIYEEIDDIDDEDDNTYNKALVNVKYWSINRNIIDGVNPTYIDYTYNTTYEPIHETERYVTNIKKLKYK